MSVHTHVVAEKRNPLGPTGEAVRANLQRLREAQNLGYTKLARILDEIGRAIPELGLRRIESGDRRVDADDLVALAVALGVSPVTLLMPTADAEDTPVTVAGVSSLVSAQSVWNWLGGQKPPWFTGSAAQYISNAWPRWMQDKFKLWEIRDGDD